MSQISLGNYIVDIFKDSVANYSENDGVHKYDFVYLSESDIRKCSTIIGLKVSKNGEVLKSALIGAGGGSSGLHKNAFLSESNRVAICCSNAIFCLSIPSLSLLWKTEADDATCFEIFKYKDDYIVHGELQITRIGNDGKIIWQQSGADIFTTLNATDQDFTITPQYILATGWGNRKHKFDFDGKAI